MTKDEKLSNFEQLLTWLPEAFKGWATSNPFLSGVLTEVQNERDARLSGAPCVSRLMTATAAVLQKLVLRRDKSAALILAASREAEETATTLASQMAAGTDLKVAATTGIRDGESLTKLFASEPDLVVTNPKTLEKVFEKGFAVPETFRTVLIDGLEWHDVMGDTDRIASLCDRLPAARQIIMTGPVDFGRSEDPFNALLHAPAFCRAPDETARETAPKERVVLVPEDKLVETLAREGEKTPALFLASSPTEGTRLAGLLKEGGIAAKRATAIQSASARETLLLKYIAGRIEHIVMPHAVLHELEKSRAGRMILTDITGGPLPYLEHLMMTADNGELVTIVTPETLPLFEKLLIAAEKRLTIENPYFLPEPRSVIGLLLRREKLTIRTNYDRGTAPDSQNKQEEAGNERRGRYEKKKPYNRKDKNGARKSKESYKERRYGKEKDKKDFQKKPRKPFAHRNDERLENDVRAESRTDDTIAQATQPAMPPATPTAVPVVTQVTAQTDTVSQNIETTDAAPLEQRPRKSRRYGPNRMKRRPYKGDATTAPQADAADIPVDGNQTTEPQPLQSTAEVDTTVVADAQGQDKFEKKRFKKPYSKNYRQKRKFPKDGQTDQSAEGTEASQKAIVTKSDAPAGDASFIAPEAQPNSEQKPKTFEKKRFQKKRPKPFSDRAEKADNTENADKPTKPRKTFEKKPRPEKRVEPKHDDWDDDNFGNSIHYQPKRQTGRSMGHDPMFQWEPADPYHPSAQALSLPQMMPDEIRRYDVDGNVNGNVKGGYNRNRKNFRKKRGQ